MLLLSCWQWMAVKTPDWETGTRRLQPVGGVEGCKTSVNHGQLGPKNDATEDEKLSELTWPRLSRLKSRLNPNFTQVRRPFHKLLYGRGICWGDTRTSTWWGIYVPFENRVQKDTYLEKKKRRRQADKPQCNRTINKKSKPHWWPDCQKDIKAWEALTCICPCSWLLSLRLHLLAI